MATAATVVLVLKKDNSVRLCKDYKITVAISENVTSSTTPFSSNHCNHLLS